MRVIQIKLSFSNAYLVTGRKTIIVDSGMPGEGRKILRAAEKAGIKPADISLILHTHGHVDHAGSTAELKRMLGNIPTAVHETDAFMLRSGTNGEVKPRNWEARMVKAMLVKNYEGFEPDLVLEEETSLQDFGVEGKVIFTPGHTNGSLSILLDNREAIIGDVMMGGVMGGNLFGSRPNYHYFIDDLSKVHASVAKILSFRPSKLYVGHGGPLEPDTVRAYFQKDIQL